MLAISSPHTGCLQEGPGAGWTSVCVILDAQDTVGTAQLLILLCMRFISKLGAVVPNNFPLNVQLSKGGSPLV